MKATKAILLVCLFAGVWVGGIYLNRVTEAEKQEQEAQAKAEDDAKRARAAEEGKAKLARMTAEIEAQKRRVEACEVWIGMSESQLIQSWGSPESRNSTESAKGTRYQYVYVRTPDHSRCGRGKVPRRAYVYVEGGTVMSIQRRD